MTDATTTMTQQAREALEPCPFCGGPASFGKIHDDNNRDFGGEFISCDTCEISTGLRFACGEDVKPLLAETWNPRISVAPELLAELTALVNAYTDPGPMGSMYEMTRCISSARSAIQKANRATTLAAQPETVTSGLKWRGNKMMLGTMLMGQVEKRRSGNYRAEYQRLTNEGQTARALAVHDTEAAARDWVYTALLAKLAGGG